MYRRADRSTLVPSQKSSTINITIIKWLKCISEKTRAHFNRMLFMGFFSTSHIYSFAINHVITFLIILAHGPHMWTAAIYWNWKAPPILLHHINKINERISKKKNHRQQSSPQMKLYDTCLALVYSSYKYERVQPVRLRSGIQLYCCHCFLSAVALM